MLVVSGRDTLSFKHVYLHAVHDRDGPSCTDAAELLATFGLVFLGTQRPVVIRPVLPPRSVVTSLSCPLTCYIHSYQHLIRLVFGKGHNDCETEIKQRATLD